MPLAALELALHCSLYMSPSGWVSTLIVQTRKIPAKHYQYRVISLDTSDIFLPDEMVAAVFNAWYRNYCDPITQRLGACPVNYLYSNTGGTYRDAIRSRFVRAKRVGGPDTPKPLPGEWRYYQVAQWVDVDELSGNDLQAALLNLSAAINNEQLMIDPELSQTLRDELMAECEREVMPGVTRRLPLLLGSFVQAFSRMPLKREASAASAYLRGSFV